MMASTWLHRRVVFGSRASVACLLVALVAFRFQSSEGAVPLEVYGHLPQLEDVALSPSGQRMALVQTDGNRRFVAIQSLTEHKLLKVIAAGEQKLRYIRWADDDHLMIVISMTLLPDGLIGHPGEWSTMQVYDLARGVLRAVPTLEEHGKAQQPQIMNVVDGYVQVRTIDGDTVLFVPGLYASDTSLLPALFRIDLQKGATTLLIKGTATTEGWLIDQAGRLAAREDYDSEHRQWQVGILQNGKWVNAVISGQASIDIPHLEGFSSDGSAVLVAFNENEHSIWRPLDLQQGKLGDPLPLPDGLPLFDRDTDRMIGSDLDDGRRFNFLDRQYQAHWDAIQRAYPEEQVRLTTYSDGFHEAIISVMGARDGYSYQLIDLSLGHAYPVGDIYQGLKELLPVKAVEYSAADGLKITAFLTLPAGREAKQLALVVLPHGGPAAHDEGGFDWWSQALASQGYAVLQPNFRGSNLDWDLMSVGFGQVGRKMETDLSDGVSYLASQGIIDPKRTCIVGASYGGYAALAGVTLFHGIYRCAVSVAGMSDLRSMMRFDDERGLGESSRGVRYWDRFLGAQSADDPQLATISPIKYASAVAVPVLMIHGTDDTVVALSQSREMFKALQALGKPSELIVLDHEDHWLSHSATRLQMLQATVDFLRKNNPPD